MLMSTYIRFGDKKLPTYDDICPLLQEYLEFIVVVGGRSLKTANMYYVTLRSFLRYIKMTNENIPEENFESITIASIDEQTLRFVTRDNITKYLFFMARQGNSEKTRKDKLTALRSFFTFLVNERGFDENPALYVDAPKTTDRQAKYLQEEEMHSLIAATAKQKNPERDYCITILLLTCGLRISELCSLNVDSFLENGTFKVLGKGKKERVLYLNNTAKNALNEWLDVRAGYMLPDDEKALFVSNRTKKRLTVRRLQTVIEQELQTAGLSGQGYSAHKLRHTAATMMYAGGAGLMELKEILGHKHTTTTEIYTHVNNERLKEITAALDEKM